MLETAYLNKSESYFENPRSEMLPFVPPDCKRLLEIGCGTAAFAALLKQSRALHVTAVEAHSPSADIARTRVDRLLSCDIDAALGALAGERFDCIVMNDVLEHLPDPWETLRQLHPLLPPGGAFVASLPNVRYIDVLKPYVLSGEWTYRKDGVMDQTHLRFFSASTMLHMFEACGYRMVRQVGINATTFGFKFALLNRLVGRRFDDARFRQFACVATPVTG